MYPMDLRCFHFLQVILLSIILRETLSRRLTARKRICWNCREGDIQIPTKQEALRHASGGSEFATNDGEYLWPNGVVPYKIGPTVKRRMRRLIYKAFAQYHQYTCIKFRRRILAHKDYIFFNGKNVCSSNVGKLGGRQKISLGDQCDAGDAVHEIMHALGFEHEHVRKDRDDFIEILWTNIKHKTYERNFNISKAFRRHKNLGVGYDYFSIMHYGAVAHSKDRAGRVMTIKSKMPGTPLGQDVGLSARDILKINKLYNCPARSKNPKKRCKADVVTDTGKCELWAEFDLCEPSVFQQYVVKNCPNACGNRCPDTHEFGSDYGCPGDETFVRPPLSPFRSEEKLTCMNRRRWCGRKLDGVPEECHQKCKIWKYIRLCPKSCGIC